ncbi:MAG TPA: universal stress protein [Fimbriimonas sp.]
MKALVGIDSEGAYAPGLHLLKKIDFPEAELTLLHACNPALIYAPFGVPAGIVAADYMDAAKKAGEACLQRAIEEAAALGCQVHSTVVLEGPAQGLTHYAELDKDDLIVVGAHRRNAAQAMFLGSVSRALAIGAKCSVLVGKGEIDHDRPLKAIFATDHSDYADRALAKLLEMRPRGIESIDVLTAYEIDDYEAALLHMELPKLGGMVDEWLEETLCERGNKVSAQLRNAGYGSAVHVKKGKANPMIARSMKELGADILIIGAQGHGFLERLLIGSVSLHQVVAEPYPVLLLRV